MSEQLKKLNQEKLTRMTTDSRGWRVLVAFTLMLVIAMGFDHYIFWANKEAVWWQTHTLEVEKALVGTFSLIQDAETSQRGYLLTNKRNYLSPFHESGTSLNLNLQNIRDLTNDNPIQRENVDRLQALTDSKLAELLETINLFDRGREQEALQLVNTDRGNTLMTQIRDLIAKMRNHELELLDERAARVSHLNTLAHSTQLVAFFCMMVTAFFVFARTRSMLRQDEKKQAMLERSNEEITKANLGLRLLTEQLDQRVKDRTVDLEEKNVRLESLAQSLDQEKRRVEELSVTDPLTGLANRVRLDEVFIREFSRSQRYVSPLSILMMDIDFFKRINDTQGHIVGDEILVSVAKLIKAQIRESDFAFRWGGEEFLILCPNTTADNSCNQAEKLRSAIEAHDFSQSLRVTVSFGVADVREGDSIISCVRRADAALYSAKENGRNRVEKCT